MLNLLHLCRTGADYFLMEMLRHSIHQWSSFLIITFIQRWQTVFQDIGTEMPLRVKMLFTFAN